MRETLGGHRATGYRWMFTRRVEGLDWGADAPGFSGWGENRAKDFVLLGAGLTRLAPPWISVRSTGARQ